MKHCFFVPGLPIAKGSAKAFYNKHLKRAVVMQTNRDKQRPWASMISYMAQEQGVKPHYGPVFVGMLFQFNRPKKHFKGKAMTLREDAPVYHCTTPDSDKLARCVLDALTSVAYHDDAQVQIIEARKIYADDVGVWLTIKLSEK